MFGGAGAAGVVVVPARWEDAEVQELAAAQQAELRGRYDGGEEPGIPPSAADIDVVLLARDGDGTPLGCGALRGLGDGAGELERMYVLRPETGPRQPEAVALYVRAGYRPVEAFGAYVGVADDSLFFERVERVVDVP